MLGFQVHAVWGKTGGCAEGSPVTGRRIGVGEAVIFWRGFGGGHLVLAVIPKRARFSAFSAASNNLVFSAFACLVLSASRRAPSACLEMK